MDCDTEGDTDIETLLVRLPEGLVLSEADRDAVDVVVLVHEGVAVSVGSTQMPAGQTYGPGQGVGLPEPSGQMLPAGQTMGLLAPCGQ